MSPLEQYFLNLTRRQFFGRMTQSLSACLGTSALARVLGDGVLGQTHFAPKAKRVIYLHMMGGPSQLDLFDYKPELVKRAGEDLRKMPEVYHNQRITGMTSGQSSLPLVPSAFEFHKHSNDMDGAWVSELYPHTAAIVRELCFVYSMP